MADTRHGAAMAGWMPSTIPCLLLEEGEVEVGWALRVAWWVSRLGRGPVSLGGPFICFPFSVVVSIYFLFYVFFYLPV